MSILCLPELCITGYGCEDAFHSPGVQRTARQVLLEIVPETRGLIVSLGLPLLHRGGLFNTACLVADGRILGFVAKQNLANEGIHYEPRWFKPWPRKACVETEVGGGNVPAGRSGVRLRRRAAGLRDLRRRLGRRIGPGRTCARRNVDIILNPSASHFAFGKHEVRKRFVLEGSRAFHVSYVYANLLGNEAGRAIYDGDAMIASGGRMLAVGPRFSFADYPPHHGRRGRRRHADEPRPRGQLSRWTWPPGHAPASRPSSPSRPSRPQADRPPLARPGKQGPHVKEEEFARARGPGAVRLPAQEPLARVRGVAQRRRRFGDGRRAGRAAGASWASAELGRDGFLEKLPYIPELGRTPRTSAARCGGC